MNEDAIYGEESFVWRRKMAFGCVGLAFLGIAYLIAFGADTKLNDTIAYGLIGVILLIGGGYIGVPTVGRALQQRSYTQMRVATARAGKVDDPDG